MRKNLNLFLLILLSTAYGYGQNSGILKNQNEAYRGTATGLVKVNIDRQTPLTQLLQKLTAPEPMVNTGQVYLIGYTDNMYSIATHGDSAIVALLQIANTSTQHNVQVAAITCIHLIGINSINVAPLREEFTNKNARQALLSLLSHDDLTAAVASLLIRDPWASDVPVLFAALKNSTSQYWPLINMLRRYQINDLPIFQPLADKYKSLFMSVRFENKDDAEAGIKAVLLKAQSYNSPLLNVDPLLLGATVMGDEGGRYPFKFSQSGNEVFYSPSITYFLGLLTAVDYYAIGNKIQYFTEGDKLTICSPKTARARLLTWWAAQPEEFRQSFKEDKASAQK